MHIIQTIDLFPGLNRKLKDIFLTADRQDFDVPTQFPDWTVKDICAHLLDTSLRRLSLERDGYVPREKISVNSYEQLVQHVTDLADRWTSAFTGVSPQILVGMIEKYQQELYLFLKTLDPFAYSFFPVSWAGEEKSYNWFDIAREYTERWHHQMQIREALHLEPLYDRTLYFPVLDTFMRALPFHYRNFKKENGYVLGVRITGSAGGTWYMEWNDGIKLTEKPDGLIRTEITISQDIAWKIFTRWTDKSIYQVTVCGDQDLGNHIKKMNCLLIAS